MGERLGQEMDDAARAKKLEEGRRKLAALRGRKKSSASCAAKCAVADVPADFVAVQVEPTKQCKQALDAPDTCASCAPETAEFRQVQHADTLVAVPDVSGADENGSATTPSSHERDTNSAPDTGGRSAQDKGAGSCAVSRWLDERNKRMRVVLAQGYIPALLHLRGAELLAPDRQVVYLAPEGLRRRRRREREIAVVEG